MGTEIKNIEETTSLLEDLKNSLPHLQLSERDMQILQMRLGLTDGIPHTLEEVGKVFNVTTTRIRLIENKAIRRLRSPEKYQEKNNTYTVRMSAEEMYMMALNYWSEDSDENDDKAFMWFERAANAGHLEAMCNTAHCYSGGFGVHRDDAMALQWFVRAAEAGHTRAMLAAAEYYASDWRGVKDEKEAFKWYLAAAKAGNIHSMVKVGKYYMSGIVCDKNLEEAAYWLDKAIYHMDIPSSRWIDLYEDMLNSGSITQEEFRDKKFQWLTDWIDWND